MQLEQQVVSLDLAKRLKELGVKQESYFVWVDKMICRKQDWENYDYSAFTVAELGEMLPRGYLSGGGYDGGFICQQRDYADDIPNYRGSEICESTEADARAKMLIYLLENKLIEKETGAVA